MNGLNMRIQGQSNVLATLLVGLQFHVPAYNCYAVHTIAQNLRYTRYVLHYTDIISTYVLRERIN